MDWDDLECESSLRTIGVRVEKVEKDIWKLYLTVIRTEIIGSLRSHLTFSFSKGNNRLAYQYELPVDASVEGPMAATPSSILVGALRRGETFSKAIQLSVVENGTSDDKLVIEAALSSDAWLATRLAPDDGGEHGVVLTVTGDGSGESKRGQVFIRCRYGREYVVGVDLAVKMLSSTNGH